MADTNTDSIADAAGTGPVDLEHGYLQSASVKIVSSANYTVLDTDGFQWILVSTGASDRTITLPTIADNNGREIVIKKTDAGAGKVIVDGESTESIDGNLTVDLVNRYDAVRVIGDSTNSIWSVAQWYVQSNPYVESATPLGHGSTNTKVRTFSSVTTVGSAITHTADTTNGDTFTINEDGLYAIDYVDGNTAAACQMGVTLNEAGGTLSSDIFTAIATKITSTREATAAANSVGYCGRTMNLSATDVLRFRDNGGNDDTGNNGRMRITQILRYVS